MTIEDIKKHASVIIDEAMHPGNKNNKPWERLKEIFETVQDKQHWKNAIPAKEYQLKDAALMYAAIVWHHGGATIEEIDGKIMIGSESYYVHCGA